MADNVSVAVRVRPFNEHEKTRGSKCCVVVDPNKPNVCKLINPSDPSIFRQFTFDHIFNSFTDDSSKIATQKTVWEAIGRPIVEAAWDGYNSTIFAYGQTGSGKSHTMVGFDHTDKGIIPNACENLFQLIKVSNDDKDITCRVECSMLEIYNEKIRDLLVPFSRKNEKMKDGLKLRESPSLGVVVEGLKSAPVSGYEQIEHLMAEGTRNRTIAATNMNMTSSRAHTCFMIKLKQTRIVNHSHQNEISEKRNLSPSKRVHGEEEEIKMHERISILNLVDLAGSERQKRSGAAGDRLKEAGAINRSLSSLGNVISALAANNKTPSSTSTTISNIKNSNRKDKHVPYRDSTLTFLLRNSLGGNARTTMLAACSPADNNFEETLSTLRYAERAKSIKNRPVINEGTDEKIVRELKNEVEELRIQLAQAKKTNNDKEIIVNNSHEAVLEKERNIMRKTMEQEMSQRIKEYEKNLQALGIDPSMLKSSANFSTLFQKGNHSLHSSTLSHHPSHTPCDDDDDEWEDRQAETDAMMMMDIISQEILNEPHFSNLNEDQALSGVLTFPLKQGLNVLGSSSSTDENDDDVEEEEKGDDDENNAMVTRIKLGGIGIGKEHAEVYRDGDTLLLMALKGHRTCINGQEVIYDDASEQQVLLNNDDCVAIGTSCILRVRIPSLDPPTGPRLIEWSTALAQANSDMIKAMQSSMMIEQREAKFESEKNEMMRKVNELETLLSIEREKHELHPTETNDGHVSELEARLAAQVEETRKLAARHEQELMGRTVLDEQLLRMLPLVHEANAISGELGKGLRFAVKLISKTVDMNNESNKNRNICLQQQEQLKTASYEEGEEEEEKNNTMLIGVKSKLTTEVAVLVHHDDDPTRDAVMWSANKFHDRIYLMREVYQLWLEGNESFENNIPYSQSIFTTLAGDPFYDPPEDTLVGVAYLQLEAVRWLLDMNEVTPLVDYKGQTQGDICVELVPHLSTPPLSSNRVVNEEEMEYEDLAEVPLNSSLSLALKLHSAKSLARKFITPSRSCYVSFRFPSKYLQNNEGLESLQGKHHHRNKDLLSFRTPRMPLTTSNPNINHGQSLQLQISKELIEFLTSSAISFELWVSVDAPGDWTEEDNHLWNDHERERNKNDGIDNDCFDDDDSDDDDESDDDGIPPHGIAMVKNEGGGGQRRREREWQLQRQDDSKHQQPCRPSPLPIRGEFQQQQQIDNLPGISLEEHSALQNEVLSLREENASLKEQLEHAMHLIASQGPPLPVMATQPLTELPDEPNTGENAGSGGGNRKIHPEQPQTVVITGKSARTTLLDEGKPPRRKLNQAQSLDREYNGRSK